jgi:hypothetical protein
VGVRCAHEQATADQPVHPVPFLYVEYADDYLKLNSEAQEPIAHTARLSCEPPQPAEPYFLATTIVLMVAVTPSTTSTTSM